MELIIIMRDNEGKLVGSEELRRLGFHVSGACGSGTGGKGNEKIDGKSVPFASKNRGFVHGGTKEKD